MIWWQFCTFLAESETLFKQKKGLEKNVLMFLTLHFPVLMHLLFLLLLKVWKLLFFLNHYWLTPVATYTKMSISQQQSLSKITPSVGAARTLTLTIYILSFSLQHNITTTRCMAFHLPFLSLKTVLKIIENKMSVVKVHINRARQWYQGYGQTPVTSQTAELTLTSTSTDAHKPEFLSSIMLAPGNQW